MIIRDRPPASSSPAWRGGPNDHEQPAPDALENLASHMNASNAIPAQREPALLIGHRQMVNIKGDQPGTGSLVTGRPSSTMDYTQLARLGRTSRRAYLAGFSIIFASWLGLGLVLTLLMARLAPGALQPGVASLT